MLDVRFCTVKGKEGPLLSLIINQKIVPINEIKKAFGMDLPGQMEELIGDERALLNLRNFAKDSRLDNISFKGAEGKINFDIPLRKPNLIWCIGLNYPNHASDLREKVPDEPASFIRPASTMIGHGDNIIVPEGIGRVTGEAEMALVMKKTPKNIQEKDALRYVFGIVCVTDMTALDILERNPRFLTRAKSYDTFFSMGQIIVTMDEITDISKLEISTGKNNQIIYKNIVDNMTFKPQFLISFHSKVFSFAPGDILSTGTPGAVELTPGDRITSQINIEGLPVLENYVVSGKSISLR